MRENIWTISLLGGGSVLCLLSPAIGQLFGGPAAWDDQMARRLQQAALQYHEALDVRASEEVPTLAAARKAYELRREALETVRRRGRRAAAAARWLGCLAIAAGLAVHVLKRFREGG